MPNEDPSDLATISDIKIFAAELLVGMGCNLVSQYLKDWWPTAPPGVSYFLFWFGVVLILAGFWQVRRLLSVLPARMWAQLRDAWHVVRQLRIVRADAIPDKIGRPTVTVTNPARQLVSDTTGTQVVRYFQLKELIDQANAARAEAAECGPRLREFMKPPPPDLTPSAIAIGTSERMHRRNREYHQKDWDLTLAKLGRINTAAYTNRPLSLDQIPELDIPTMKAPGEELFTDGAAQWRYRKFHFLIPNVHKAAGELIADMERELENIRTAWRNTPGPDWATKFDDDKA